MTRPKNRNQLSVNDQLPAALADVCKAFPPSCAELQSAVVCNRRATTFDDVLCVSSPANRHSRNSDFKFVLKSTEYFKGTFPLKANFVQQFLDFNCFEGNVGETSESRGGEHNYGLF